MHPIFHTICEFLLIISGSLVFMMFKIASLFFLLSVLQFEPAPRRGEPDVTRRTPDYFL